MVSWVQSPTGGNIPAATGANTFFGFIFEADWKNIPIVKLAAAIKDMETDFEATDDAIELEEPHIGF